MVEVGLVPEVMAVASMWQWWWWWGRGSSDGMVVVVVMVLLVAAIVVIVVKVVVMVVVAGPISNIVITIHAISDIAPSSLLSQMIVSFKFL